MDSGHESDDSVTYEDLHNGFPLYQRRNQAPIVEVNDQHSVLFNLPLPVSSGLLPVPSKSSKSSQILDVNMPHHSKPNQRKPRWAYIIKTLRDSKIKNSYQFESKLRRYCETKIKKQFCGGLLKSPQKFFETLLPKIIELALRLPTLIQSPIPLLQRHKSHSISMSQEQVACILANAFLCTFPVQKNVRRGANYAEINFVALFSARDPQVLQKLHCICNYFKRVCTEEMPSGVITYKRVHISDLPELEKSDVQLSRVKVDFLTKTACDQGAGMLKVTYTQNLAGKNVFGWECFEENEIPYFLYPEMIAGMLFCESMDRSEAIVVSGCEKFNRHSGNGEKFAWSGNFIDDTPRDSYRRRLTSIVAIDGMQFGNEFHEQFQAEIIVRDFKKAFVGFYHNPSDGTPPIPVCSRKWTCGKHKGSKHLKFLIQLMACSFNGRNLLYCTGGEVKFRNELRSMVNYIAFHNITAGMLFEILNNFKTYSEACVSKRMLHPHRDLFKFVCKCHFENFILPRLLRHHGFHNMIQNITQSGELVTDKKFQEEVTSETT